MAEKKEKTAKGKKVPVYQTCARCGGKGKVGKSNCPSCKGVGGKEIGFAFV